ncbi:16S rRNA (uracil(1498)-N(3))-methyltransferase [Salinicoccus sp. ID82-1]|uniref:Ribosomal RNA small subunit methyltransferase E n=1 Tax=Salinicoccus cyprini TaxID=2493691 RepID=A0A558AYN9_9STAP|nr:MULTISPECIES: RsmE family RNA methyltransferase [Salinicoccus]MCG1008912.1 16S rRNA (uracil(1498)-N(3))-methyltransferase [Salinicoccus sp. ID82-1]TVT29373.1 16S rRNA (uracil(1498)-N(3))-methyltransferase [Salinicoccus cyprini]
MQRYFIDEALEVDQHFSITSDDAHHMKNVMRFRPEDTFHAVDQKQCTYLCEIAEVSHDIDCRVISAVDESPELPVKVTLYCPLLKGEKFDWMIQKATELGAHEFLIYEADRSIVRLDDKKRKKRLERFGKIVKEASEQSRRQVIPNIDFVPAVDRLDFEEYDRLLFAFEGNALNPATNIQSAISDIAHGSRIAFIFGPEGGFSEAETKQLSKHHSIRLGPRILRAETAPLYALSAISNSFETPASN